MKKEKILAEERLKESVNGIESVQQTESAEEERERRDEEPIWRIIERLIEMSSQMYKENPAP